MKIKVLVLLSLLVLSVAAMAAENHTADSVAGKIVIDGNLDDWAVNGKPKSVALDFGTEEQLVRQSGWTTQQCAAFHEASANSAKPTEPPHSFTHK